MLHITVHIYRTWCLGPVLIKPNFGNQNWLDLFCGYRHNFTSRHFAWESSAWESWVLKWVLGSHAGSGYRWCGGETKSGSWAISPCSNIVIFCGEETETWLCSLLKDYRIDICFAKEDIQVQLHHQSLQKICITLIEEGKGLHLKR